MNLSFRNNYCGAERPLERYVAKRNMRKVKPIFLNKMNIALKEANETTYWLNLLKDTDYLDVDLYEPLIHDCLELVKILTKTVKTTKENLRKGCL